MSDASQSIYAFMLDALTPADRARHLEADIDGHQVLWDKSGIGHAWVLASAISMPTHIRNEIASEILDGKVTECSNYLASNGQRYQWS